MQNLENQREANAAGTFLDELKEEYLWVLRRLMGGLGGDSPVKVDKKMGRKRSQNQRKQLIYYSNRATKWWES